MILELREAGLKGGGFLFLFAPRLLARVITYAAAAFVCLALAIAVLSTGTYFVEKAKVRAMTTKKAKKPIGAFA